MADLIAKPVRKSDAPISPHEERARRARASVADWNSSMAKQAPRDPAPSGPTNHLSGFGGHSTMKEAERQTVARKADILAALPARAKAIAEPLSDGQKSFVANVYERHGATGECVAFTKAEAGTVMGLSADAAGKTVEGLVTAGILKPVYSSLGGLSGYVPAILD